MAEMELESPMTHALELKRFRIPAVVLLVIVILAAAAYMYQTRKGPASGDKAAAAAKDGNGKEKTAVPVNVAAVSAGPISSYVVATANLVAENEVKVVSEADGRVDRLLVEEGDYIQQGQPLAVLARGDAQILREKARVRAGNARVAFARARDMHSKELLSQDDFEKISMEKGVADQELAEAEYRLSKATIRAPFSGTVTERMINAGQHVRPSDVLFTLTDFDPLVARIFLPERDVLSLRNGREVRLTLRAADEIAFRGRIRQISPVVDTSTGTVKVTVEAVNPPAAVRPGAFVTVEIVRETKAAALRIPRESVIRELREAHVFITDGKVARRREVTLGIEEGNFVEALSGLQAGQRVIVAGQGALKDGSPVKVATKS